MEQIQPDFMVFVGEGSAGIASVREVRPDAIVIYVENGGEFVVPMSAVRKVHDDKVILAPEQLAPDLVHAIRHEHDREDPNVAG